MKTIEVIKKAVKLNESLKEFGFDEKYVAFEVGYKTFEFKSINELKKQLNEEYVKEFYKGILEVDLDENLEASGKFLFETYEGKASDTWDADYQIRVIVA